MFKLNLESIKAEYRNVELVSAPLFDENGSDSYTNQMIIGGKPSGIVNMNTVRHQWAVTIFNKMWSQMWQPQFVDMSSDKISINQLTQDELESHYDTISFLAFMDSFQQNNLPNVFEYITSPMVKSCGSVQEAFECYVDGTEVLTPDGWKLFQDLTPYDKVAQYSLVDKSVEFVSYTNPISKLINEDVVVFSGKHGEMLCVTGGHNMVGFNYRKQKFVTGCANDFTYTGNDLKTSGFKKCGKSQLSDFERFLIALQADGTLCNSGYRNGIKSNTMAVTFSLKKQRKKDRLESLLGRLCFEYTKNAEAKDGYHVYYIKVPKQHTLSKVFDWVDTEGVSSEWCSDFLDEVAEWDGHKINAKRKSFVYSSIIHANVDVVERLSVLCGRTTHHYSVQDNRSEKYSDMYCIRVFETDSRSRGTIEKAVKPYSGVVRCVSVPSGVLVVKYNNQVSVCGNCMHTQAYQFSIEATVPANKRDAIYDRWKENPKLKARIQTMTTIAENFKSNPTLENYYIMLVMNYILEGFYFYQGFNYYDQLAHRGKLTGTAKQIDYIRRDEQVHRGLFVNIIKEIGIDTKLINDMMLWAFKEEEGWNHTVYGDRILGMSKKSQTQYAKYLINGLLSYLGLESMFENVENPYLHLEQTSQEGSVRENFFETTVTSYDTAGSIEGWDEL